MLGGRKSSLRIRWKDLIIQLQKATSGKHFRLTYYYRSISTSCLQQHSNTSGSNSTEQTSRDWSDSVRAGRGGGTVGLVSTVGSVSSRHSRGSGQSEDDSLELHCNEWIDVIEQKNVRARRVLYMRKFLQTTNFRLAFSPVLIVLPAGRRALKWENLCPPQTPIIGEGGLEEITLGKPYRTGGNFGSFTGAREKFRRFLANCIWWTGEVQI